MLGSPVAHSLSPVMHRAAYDALGLAGWTYDAVETTEADLEGRLDGLDATWRGLSLTMPLKRRAVALVDSLDDWAERSGAVNTVVLDEGSRRGMNTDVPGAVAALRERVRGSVREVVVLGGGATATSTLLASAELGCTRARLLVRDPSRAVETVAQAQDAGLQVDVEALDEALAGGPLVADLLVSTVPVAAQTPPLLEVAAGVPAVFDVLYDPWPTPLARSAESSGRVAVTGLDLLAHQAVLQLELMTDRTVSPDLLRGAARRELAARGAH